MTTARASQPQPLLRQYLVLTKPRVTQLAVFCAVIGMFLATPGLPDMGLVLAGTAGIWLLAAAAFAVNCLIEQEVDARMLRTARRATASGTISNLQVIVFSGVLGGAGMLVLYHLVNPLTMWLTFATFVGYAIIYTMVLKPLTPQNIVIGGLSGAMPPALGWATIANAVPAEAWILVLIIFIWTPPHFWALALFVRTDYAAAGIPMLPVVSGEVATRRQIWFYTAIMAVAAMAPVLLRLTGLVYGVTALLGTALFALFAFQVYRHREADPARMMPERRLFKYSIFYLFLLFGAVVADRWWLG